ncbi:hypothetical protein [Pseudorhodoferax sp. Leaf267]|uniref:hypothetical protein n=1 Tax=Pseudorhodoferax sp. Leaf267 TaxID=1736316 RepID=UPI0006FFDA6B|nr:hypothetical protein [Pseudorhodoferax sp. Leaf267]KQP14077.1 hypothetical protein ASF43_14635 [Pseudorhodoferax sp. Leaf267]
MASQETDLLGREWTALHRDCELQERSALWIKLGAVALSVVALALAFDTVLTLLLLAVLWLQEAIVRTGQSRLNARLLNIETLLRAPLPGAGQACQLYSEWAASRPGHLGLIGEYLGNALRPTVAFPYAVLLVLLWTVSATA